MRLLIAIREAEKSDLPGVLALFAQPDMDCGSVLQLDRAELILGHMSDYPFYKMYVAVSEGRVIGAFALLVMVNLGHMGAPSAVIEDVVVAPELHSRGVGRQMMEYALCIAKARNCYKVMLSSNLKRERAHAFYEELGFERHGYSFQILI